MSCGNPHRTPCSEVLSLVYVYIDQELDEVQRVEVTAHLSECPPCGQQFAVEQVIKARVHRSCAPESAPDRLRASIVASIQQVTITYRSE